MNIGFEAKRLFTNFTGLGNYGRFVVDALSRHQPENRYVLFTPKQKVNTEIEAIIKRSNIEIVGPPGLYKLVSAAWRTFGISTSEQIKRMDVFHGLSQELPFALNKGIRKVVTVHDLIFLRFPEYYNPIDVAIYRAKVASACKRADVIVAISLQTKADLVSFLRVPEHKIKVVYQGCHPTFKRLATHDEKQRVREKYLLPGQYILNVGTIEPRKNVSLLIKALSVMPGASRVPVVIVGRKTKYFDELSALVTEKGLQHEVHFIHNASFEDLPALYQMATVFVYPSRFEGFGIPLVEAIESRVPVVTSTGSCFTEAAGPNAVYVDPDDVTGLSTALTSILGDDNRRNEMVLASHRFAERFAPNVIANDLIGLYRG